MMKTEHSVQELLYDTERLSVRHQLYLYKITHMNDSSVDTQIEELERTKEVVDDHSPAGLSERAAMKACCTIS